MDLNGKTIFVTGGTGKIGRHLVNRLLCEGALVRVLLRSEKNYWNQNPHVEIIKGDILDSGALKTGVENCEYIFHLAVHQDARDRDFKNFERVNIEGTRILLNAANSSKMLKKIIYVSTAMVFESTPGCIAAEDWPQRKDCEDDFYLKSKIQALEYIRQYMKNLPIVVVYPTAVIDFDDFKGAAPARPGTLEYFIWEKIGGGIPGGLVNLIGRGNRKFNYVIINDLVDGLIKSALYGAVSDEYLLAGHNISARDYLAVVSKKMRRKTFLFRIPVFPFKVLSFLRRFIRIPQIVDSIAKGDYADRSFSYDKARKAFAYEAHTRIEDQ